VLDKTGSLPVSFPVQIIYRIVSSRYGWWCTCDYQAFVLQSIHSRRVLTVKMRFRILITIRLTTPAVSCVDLSFVIGQLILATYFVLSKRLSLWLIGTVRAEPETVISRAWVQSPGSAE